MNQKNLKQLATKKDLEKLATKKQLEGTDRKIDGIDKRLKSTDRRVDTIDKKVDTIAVQVIKNTEEIKRMGTKTEFNQFRQEMLKGQDKMITILQKLDQERLFIFERGNWTFSH